MKTYIYTYSTGKSHYSGGRTRTFTVYRLKRNQPEYIGNFKVNTASYGGDTPSVNAFIQKQTNSKQAVMIHAIGGM